MQDNFLIDRIMSIIEFESPVKLRSLFFKQLPKKVCPACRQLYFVFSAYIQTPGIISNLTLFPLITQNLTPLTEITQLIQP